MKSTKIKDVQTKKSTNKDAYLCIAYLHGVYLVNFSWIFGMQQSAVFFRFFWRLDHFYFSLSDLANAQNKFSNERRSTSQLEQRTDDDDAQKKARWWWRKRRRLYLLGGKIVVVVCFSMISIFFFFCRPRCSSFQQRRWCVWRFPRPRPRLIDSIPRKTNSLACVLRNSSPAQGDA